MSELHAHWHKLIAQPLAFVSAREVQACLSASAPCAQIQQLLQLPRFSQRLLHLLMQRQQLAPLDSLSISDECDLTVLLLTPERFAQLPRLCGAVWHGAALSREIRSDVVTQLRGALGDDVYAHALAHRHLAGAANLLREPAQLIEAIDLDGAACVNDWLHTQTPALQGWLSLRLPRFTEERARLPTGARVVRELASLLFEEQEASQP
ncbi:hypothetical protein [Pseudomonas fluorescens]|uniref:Type III secretion protein n=1 Tax=Pseudomonas fluorescens TaxID=294 RepID=A0A0F4V708_PSEFL|nr:hypothetical protein [Pseudomonas fluorescens]KJZ64571.1 hypothetical protein VD17_16995 [Pseudomonas fluorescens]